MKLGRIFDDVKYYFSVARIKKEHEFKRTLCLDRFFVLDNSCKPIAGATVHVNCPSYRL